MRYKQALDYLNSFTNYEQLPGVRYTDAMDDGLDRVRLLLRLLGRPQNSFSSIVIAGTKGKGSVAAMLDSMLREAGYKTGLYTSPHLHTFRERIRVAGEMISAADVARLTGEIAPVVRRIVGLEDPGLLPTTYELATALAFLYFREENIDIAVLEVGLGGRLDAVNVVTPVVSVITSVSLDHTQVLGNTLAEIAWEKAGIVKPGGTVVSAPQEMEALGVIKGVAAEKKANLIVVGKDTYISSRQLPRVVFDGSVPLRQVFTVAFRSDGHGADVKTSVELPLLGAHQQVNAAVAMATLPALVQAGLPLDRKAVLRGLAKVTWPGRLEVIRRDPLVIVDGAHNVESFARLQAAIAQLFHRRHVVMVLAVSRDKPIAKMLGQLAGWSSSIEGPVIDRVIVTETRHPRAAGTEELASMAAEEVLPVEVASSVGAAMVRAEEIVGRSSGADGALVLVTGSLFAVAEAREHYGLVPEFAEENS